MFIGSRISKGLSDVVAVVIMLGLAIAISMAFMSYIRADYGARQSWDQILSVVERDRLNTIVRLVSTYNNGFSLMLKRLDGGNRIAFFIFNGTGYPNCSKVIGYLSGGSLEAIYRYRVEDIAVISNGYSYSFKYYARANKMPDSGYINICVVRLGNNTLVGLRASEGMKPVASGGNYTVVDANNRLWRLYGVLEFRVAFVNPGKLHLYYNGTGVELKQGDTIRLEINTTTGQIDLTPQLINGANVAWVNAFDNVYAKSLYINGGLLAQNVYVRIISEVGIDISSIKSTLTADIYPLPPGFTRVIYGGQTLIDYWNNSDFIRVVGWTINESTQMVIRVDPVLHAQGIASAVYIGKAPQPTSINLNLSLFTVTLINNVPYVVNRYDYTINTINTQQS